MRIAFSLVKSKLANDIVCFFMSWRIILLHEDIFSVFIQLIFMINMFFFSGGLMLTLEPHVLLLGTIGFSPAKQSLLPFSLPWYDYMGKKLVRNFLKKLL